MAIYKAMKHDEVIALVEAKNEASALKIYAQSVATFSAASAGEVMRAMQAGAPVITAPMVAQESDAA